MMSELSSSNSEQADDLLAISINVAEVKQRRRLPIKNSCRDLTVFWQKRGEFGTSKFVVVQVGRPRLAVAVSAFFCVDFLQKCTPHCAHNLQSLYHLRPKIASNFSVGRQLPGESRPNLAPFLQKYAQYHYKTTQYCPFVLKQRPCHLLCTLK